MEDRQKATHTNTKRKMSKAGIKTKKKTDGNTTLVIPKDVEKQAKEEFNFSFNMLKVGGELPLIDLAEHIDEQASHEARFGMLTENARYLYQVKEQEYEIWYNEKYNNVRKRLTKGTSKPTEKAIHAYIISRYSAEYKTLKAQVATAEHVYRLLNNAIYASIITKGKMLQSLRNVLMGNSGVGLNVESEKSIKVKT